MKATARKLILTVLAVLASGAAAASDHSVFTGRSIGPMAELSSEERAWFRDNWQRLPAEDREAVRRKLRQEWADLPPEVRQRRMQELANKVEEKRKETWQREQERDDRETGFGQGFDSRPWGAQDMGGARQRGRR